MKGPHVNQCVKKHFILIMYRFFVAVLVLAALAARTDLSAEGAGSLYCSTSSEYALRNRLRLFGEGVRLSLIAESDGAGFSFVEPVLLSELISVGRLRFRGALREYYSSSPFSAGSTVYAETSGISVSDSFCRSTMFGLHLRIPSYEDFLESFSLWAERADAGNASAGMIVNGIGFTLADWFRLEADLIGSAGTSPASVPDGWFSDEVLLPGQTVLNFCGTLRAGLGEGPGASSARRSFRRSGEGFHAAASVSAEMSRPQYTPGGYRLRAAAGAGGGPFFITGCFCLPSENYISPSGRVPGRAESGGLSLLLRLPLAWKTEIGLDYDLALYPCGLLIGRYLEQEDEVSVSASADSGIVRIKAGGGYRRQYDRNGCLSDRLKASGSFRARAYDFLIAASTVFTVSEPGLDPEPEIKISAEAGWKPGPVELKGGCSWSGCPGGDEYDGGESELKLRMRVSVPTFVLSAKFSYTMKTGGEADAPLFTLSLESGN